MDFLRTGTDWWSQDNLIKPLGSRTGERSFFIFGMKYKEIALTPPIQDLGRALRVKWGLYHRASMADMAMERLWPQSAVAQRWKLCWK